MKLVRTVKYYFKKNEGFELFIKIKNFGKNLTALNKFKIII